MECWLWHSSPALTRAGRSGHEYSAPLTARFISERKPVTRGFTQRKCFGGVVVFVLLLESSVLCLSKCEKVRRGEDLLVRLCVSVSSSVLARYDRNRLLTFESNQLLTGHFVRDPAFVCQFLHFSWSHNLRHRSQTADFIVETELSYRRESHILFRCFPLTRGSRIER